MGFSMLAQVNSKLRQRYLLYGLHLGGDKFVGQDGAARRSRAHGRRRSGRLNLILVKVEGVQMSQAAVDDEVALHRTLALVVVEPVDLWQPAIQAPLVPSDWKVECKASMASCHDAAG
eukprot:6205349-Pleurochrysis_carterae.AAC.1